MQEKYLAPVGNQTTNPTFPVRNLVEYTLAVINPLKTKIKMNHVQLDRQCTYKRNILARSRNHCCRGKAISVTYS